MLKGDNRKLSEVLAKYMGSRELYTDVVVDQLDHEEVLEEVSKKRSLSGSFSPFTLLGMLSFLLACREGT